MRRILATTVVAVTATAGMTSSVSAEGSEHNCAGAVSSASAQQFGATFGAIVAAAGQDQLVDNFGLRNCGAAEGRNP